MTIFEHDRVSTSHDGSVAESAPSTQALVDLLNAGEPYAVIFGGQGGTWLESLEELVNLAGIESELSTLVGEAELLLEPIARELVVVRPVGFEPLRWVRALAAGDPVPSQSQLTAVAISAPGILLTQMAAIRALTRQGLDLTATPPVAMAGHSQGIFGCESLKAGGARDAELLALLQLQGAAGSLVSRRRGMVGRGDKSPMLSVTNADPDRIAELLHDFSQDVRTVQAPVLSIRNGRRSVVITGTPEQLTRFELYCTKITEKEEAERKNKLRGGAVFRPAFKGILFEVGFHTPRLAGRPRPCRRLGVALPGLDPELARFDPRKLRRPGRLGRRSRGTARGRRPLDRRSRPRRLGTRVTAPVIRGLGIGIVPAATRSGTAACSPPAPSPTSTRPGRATRRRGDAARRLGEAVDQVHPVDGTFADPAGRHDADDRRRQDRGRGRQRRPLGRAGRWRTGHRGDLQRPYRRADHAVGARS